MRIMTAMTLIDNNEQDRGYNVYPFRAFIRVSFSTFNLQIFQLKSA